MRLVAAALGGYLLSSGAAIVLALLLPGNRADAVVWAVLCSYLLYALVIIWVFAQRSLANVWLVLLVLNVVLGGLVYLLTNGELL